VSRAIKNRDRAPLEPAQSAETHDNETLHLAAEELSVTKRAVETGRVRISTQTRERDVLVDENLACERVEIERVPVGQKIEKTPDVREDGDTTIIPVVEEVLAVERYLMLKEEIRIRRVRTIERHQEKVTLRHQEAVVTRQETGTNDPGAIAASGLGKTKPKPK